MSSESITRYYDDLSDAQRKAADFQDGSFLLLAGPGSGKTRVLTARLARLLNESEGQKFRVLALTFTNQAGSEMRERLEDVVPDAGSRAFVGTFHSFCTELLRQYGSHVSVQPDFTILSDESDRRTLLTRAISSENDLLDSVRELEDRKVQVLPLIDRLKSKVIQHSGMTAHFQDRHLGEIVAAAYDRYDAAMRETNALDFPSILTKTYDLILNFPRIAKNIRVAYRYWSVDEFQDTNEIQFEVINTLAGPDFKNIFVVADEDQIIYQWNGASYRRIEEFVSRFEPQIRQLPKNYRCPEPIVRLANNLISHNSLRRADKKPIEAISDRASDLTGETIEVLSHSDDRAEAESLARRIKSLKASGNSIAILGRNRFVLEMAKEALDAEGIASRLVQRRTDFISRAYSLGYRLIRFCVRNQDEDLLDDIVDDLADLTDVQINAEDVKARAKSTQMDLYLVMIYELDRNKDDSGEDIGEWIDLLRALNEREATPDEFIQGISRLVAEPEDSSSGTSDLDEDREAWRSLNADIRRAGGSKQPLDRYLQELDMRSKEPPMKPDEVALMTIHSSKGREFDIVILVGLAEEVLPSWQSLRSGDTSQELEEERRNCFVAITRARQKLILSYAARYRGWAKQPSRFLGEIGIDLP